MTKTHFVFLFIINVTTLFAQYDDPYQYYPMATDNYWYYSMGPGYFYNEKIYADSTDSIGNMFCWPYPKDIFSLPFYCIDKNYFFIIRPTSQINTKEYLYKLDAEIGDRWWVWRSAADTNIGTWCQLSGISDGTYLGIPTSIKTYMFNKRIKKNNEYYDFWDHREQLAYGLGLIYRDNDAEYPSYLVGAIINGKVIGNPVNVKETHGVLPANCELLQNYPNPFNPTTTISFSLPKYSHVVVKVFDVLGNEIKVLANGYFDAGEHKVEFNAGNLSSGIYFCQLFTNKTIKTMKMVLQK